MSTRNSPSRHKVWRAAGEPLMNWRLAPAAVKERLSTSCPSSHGSRPLSARNSDKLDESFRIWRRSKTASTVQWSEPLRMRVRSARSPRSRLRAPMRMDLPAPVSPVMTLRPGCSSRERSATRARFLMRSVLSMAEIVGPDFGQAVRLAQPLFRNALGNSATPGSRRSGHVIYIYFFGQWNITGCPDHRRGISGAFSGQPEESSHASIDLCGDRGSQAGGGHHAGIQDPDVAGEDQ